MHDLNILHDALGFSGPLRMRLNFTTPRFIVRYHALQDQITRLHLEQPNHPQAGEETAEKKNEGEFPFMDIYLMNVTCGIRASHRTRRTPRKRAS